MTLTAKSTSGVGDRAALHETGIERAQASFAP